MTTASADEATAMASSVESSSPTLSVIVPTYRERENLPTLIEEVGANLQAAGIDYEIVIVDDNSNDGTEEFVASLPADACVRLLVRRTERGLASAVVHGFDHAHGRVLLCMDADLSHPPERVPAVVQPLIEGDADFTIGSRYVPGGSLDEGWGWWRRLNSRAATWLARPLTSVRDPMAGFFGLTRDRYQAAEDVNSIGYKIGLELLVKSRPERCVEVPIHFKDRCLGESKLSFRTQLEYVWHVARLMGYRLKSSDRTPRQQT